MTSTTMAHWLNETSGVYSTEDGLRVQTAENVTQVSSNMDRIIYLRVLAIIQGAFHPQYDIVLIIAYLLFILLGQANWFIVCCLLSLPALRKMPFNVLVGTMAIVNGVSCSLAAPMDIYDICTSFTKTSTTWCIAKIGIRAFCFNTVKSLIFATALIRLIIGCFSKPARVRYCVMVPVSLACCAIGILAAFNNTDATGSPMKICMGNVMQLGNDRSFYFSISLTMFIATALCYIALAVVLKLRAYLKHTPNVSHHLNQSIVLLSYKAAVNVTIIYSVSYLSPFITIIVRAANGIPDLPYLLHYLAIYSALLYIQAAGTPLAFIATNKILRKHLTFIKGKMQSSVAPTSQPN